MADSKTIISEAEEKMDMAVMYLDESLAHIRAGKADVRFVGRYPRRFLRKHGAHQQCSGSNYS